MANKNHESNMLIFERLWKLRLGKFEYYPAEEIYLIGSRSKGTNTVDSDVDILIKFFDLELLDMDNPMNSVFHYKHFERLRRKIENTLGMNPYAKKPFKVDLVGSYELRYFNWDENYTKMKFDIFK